MINRLFQLAVLVCLFPVFSYAQTSEGNLMLGGHFNAKISRQEQLLIFDASPGFGIFVSDHLAVGGNVDIGLARYGETNKHITLGILPTARYFFGDQNTSRFFLQAEAGYHRVNISVADIFIARSGMGAGAGAGLAYFFNQTVSLEGLFKVRAFRYTDSTNALQTNLSLGLNLYLPSHRIN